MSAFIARKVVGMVVFAALGAYWGVILGQATNSREELYAVVLGLLGVLVGLVITPYITTRPVRALRGLLARLSSHTWSQGSSD